MTILALCIGNNVYRDPIISDLSGAERDAYTLAATLEMRGIEVTVLAGAQATEMAIHDWLFEAKQRLSSPDDMILIYFAGHAKATRQGGQNDLLMLLYHARYGLLTGPSRTTPGVLSLLAMLAVSPQSNFQGRVVPIIDACRLPLDARESAHRDGTNTTSSDFGRVFRGLGLGVAMPESRLARHTILNSCKDKQKAEELTDFPGGTCGVYTRALVDLMRSSNDDVITLSPESTRTQITTRMADLIRQHGSGDLQQEAQWTGDQTPIVLPTAARTRPAANQPDIATSSSVEPRPAESQPTESQLAQPDDPQPAEPQPTRPDPYDERLWQLAVQLDTEESYIQYLDDDALQGFYRDKAKEKLGKV